MCRFKLFTIAAAALMMAACSTEDITQQPKTGEMQFTATIAAPSNGGTRTAYTVDGTDIKVAWKVGDEIALVHNYVKDVATVKSVDATTGQATISGIITGTPADEDAVKLIYPAVYISGVNNDGFPTMDEDYYNLLFAQDGTLDYIQNNIDFRQATGQLSVTETGVTLKSTVIMESSMAIWKLQLKDDATTNPADLAASLVTIKGKFTSDGQDEDLASTTKLSPGASTVYLAVPVMSDTYASLSIMALVDDDIYTCTKENVTLAPGKYYQSTVTMAKATIDLSKLTGDYTAKNGETLTGTLAGNYKISIADGATVTLDGITINGVHNNSYKWAGITCEGDATIILKDGSTNSVRGFHHKYPGIFVPKDKTLTIKGETLGTGSLEATGSKDNEYEAFWGAGIGGGYEMESGNIVIQGGIITAYGDENGAGIGSGGCEDYNASCGNITITGGTINATGGRGGAAIGSGGASYPHKPTSCGTITITDGVTLVKATKGGGAPYSIGSGNNGSCGTVTIGGVETGFITESPYIYPAPTIGDVGNPIGFNGGGDPLANN